MKNVALIMAAGTSQRCGFDKLVAQLGNQTVLERCLHTFCQCELVDDIWVVGRDLTPEGKLKGSITGGNSRFDSVQNGLKHCAEIYDQDVRIIVHNAANPWLKLDDLNTGLAQTVNKPNLIFGFFTPNSIKQVSKNGLVKSFLDREEIFETQTPQISLLSTFSKAISAFDNRHSTIDNPPEPRDEAELLALIDEPIHVYECDPSNTKVTYPSDLPTHCHPEFSSGSPDAQPEIPDQVRNDIRIGLGEDSHRFAKNFIPDKPFRLGGVDVSEGTLSSDGNSDGDVIVHALCNALLNAHGDTTFDPIAAPICQAGDTYSVSYLKATLEYLTIHHQPFTINQVLISLEGARPRLAPQHQAIVQNLAQLLGITPNQIGLTYTTGEGLNAYGRGEGMRSYVLVVLKNSL